MLLELTTTRVLIEPDIYNLLLQWGYSSIWGKCFCFTAAFIIILFLNSTYVNLISYSFSCSKLHSYGPRRTSAQWRQNHPSSSTGKMANAKIKVAYKRRKTFLVRIEENMLKRIWMEIAFAKTFRALTTSSCGWGTTFIISTIFRVASPSLSSTNVALSKNASGNWNTMKVTLQKLLCT